MAVTNGTGAKPPTSGQVTMRMVVDGAAGLVLLVLSWFISDLTGKISTMEIRLHEATQELTRVGVTLDNLSEDVSEIKIDQRRYRNIYPLPRNDDERL